MIRRTQIEGLLSQAFSSRRQARLTPCDRITAFAKNCMKWPLAAMSFPMQYAVQHFTRRAFEPTAKTGSNGAIDYEQYERNGSVETPTISSPLPLKNGAVLANRLIKAGITDGLCDFDGNPTNEMIELYTKYGNGGFGMVISPDVSVDRRAHLPSIGQSPIFDEVSSQERFSQLAAAMKGRDNSVAAILQLTHPGSVVSFSEQAVAPSRVWTDSPRCGIQQLAHALTDDEIDSIVNLFASSAQLAEQCGFNGIQFVASNGYLPTQFFDRNVNVRSGRWAGDTFMRAVIERMCANRTAPDFTIGLKVNSADFQKGGWTAEEASSLVKNWCDIGIDFLEIGGGNCEAIVEVEQPSNASAEREQYFFEFSQKIFENEETLPIMSTGGWRSPATMERMSNQHPNALFGIGRPTCVDPSIGSKLLQGDVSRIPDWFQIHIPTWIQEKKNSADRNERRVAHGLEMSWYGLGVASMAVGNESPKIQQLFHNPLEALAIKALFTVKASMPRSFYGAPLRQHPLLIK